MKTRHLRNLHTGKKLEFITSNGRTNNHADELGLNTVLRKRMLEQSTAVFDHLLVDLLGNRTVEHLERWQFPIDLSFLWKRHCELLGLRGRNVTSRNVDIKFVGDWLIVRTSDKEK